MRERLALTVMYQIGQAFRQPGQTVSANDISERTNIPSIALAPIIASLESGGLDSPD